MSLRADRMRAAVWERRGKAGWLGYTLLRPLSEVFGLGVTLKNLGYELGVFPVEQPPLPVISVGNLAVGGTGKTPFTLWLARSLRERGVRIAILSRGYRGRSGGVTVVSTGAGPLASPSEVGDEAVMLARCFDGVLLTAPRRSAGVKAAAELGCDAVLLDDGFQHRRIARCVDLVLLNGRRGPLLPAGPLRERLNALRRADVLILVDHGSPDHLQVPHSAAGKPVHRVQFEPTSVMQSACGHWQPQPLSLLAGRRVVAVAGIARPERFYQLLRQWDVMIEEIFEFPDHHDYTPADWQRINRSASGADFVVTTEKDLVKLEAFPFATGKLIALRIEPCVERSEELLEMILAKAGLGSAGQGGDHGDQ
jgi:tetraacyldisaccharide 4'-kinase